MAFIRMICRLSLHKKLYTLVERLVELLPDWITGDVETMKKKYSRLYGSRSHSRLIKENKTLTMKRYLLILSSFIILTTAFTAGQSIGGEEIDRIARPEYGEDSRSMPVSVKIKYRNYEFSKNMMLKVPGRKLGREETLNLLDLYKKQLKNVILGENNDLDHISKPLNLIERDHGSRITIEWTSSMPDLISEEGTVDLIRAKKGQTVELTAKITMDDVTVSKVYPVRIEGVNDPSEYESNLDSRLKERLDQAIKLNHSSKVILPNDLGDGIEARWFKGNENNVANLSILFIIFILIVYFKRYDRIDAETKKMEESLIRDLPEFINKLVLLLNAGLVVNSAFSKIADNYSCIYREKGSAKISAPGKNKRYLYDELFEIEKKIEQSNASLIHELRDFSQRSGVREMIRLTAIMSDNWDKGSTLAEKLEGERELLWISRKRRAEERGKIAETKLTFPLMIQLIVLIMITIAPAMLEM